MTTSPIRCAGGKRLLAKRIVALMPPPGAVTSYVEPFMGGAAVFFALHDRGYKPETVLLGDKDADLVSLFTAIRDDAVALTVATNALIDRMKRVISTERFYFDERNRWNTEPGARTAARHLFLRKCAFNGLWRVNKSGGMNTPYRKAMPKYIGTQLADVSRALQGVQLVNWDFRAYDSETADSTAHIGPGTVMFCDPPYLSTTGGFTSYCGSWAEQDTRDLLRLSRTWSERGAHVVLSHSDTEQFRDLLRAEWPSADAQCVTAKRSINRDGAGRGGVAELLVVDRRHVTCHSAPRAA